MDILRIHIESRADRTADTSLMSVVEEKIREALLNFWLEQLH